MSALPNVLPLPRVSQPRTAPRSLGASEAITTALEAVRANKTRSLLTTLGIIIGVGAVIIMVSLGQGASASVAQRLQGLGTNVLTIQPGGQRGPGAVSAGAGSNRTLTEADATALSEQIAGVSGVSPVQNNGVQAVAAGTNWATQAQGVYPSYQSIENWQLQTGTFFSAQDQQDATSVAVLGQTVVDNLFGDGTSGSGNAATAIGQTVRLNNVPFIIVGVLASKSQQQDNVILIPFSTAHIRLSNQTYVNQIAMQVSDASQMSVVQTQIQAVLEQRHNITNGKDDFSVFNLSSVVQTAESVTQTLTMLLAGVAGVSLVVGGIGIMNIMLVSVSERTREIGIRTAIGARRSDILGQFLIEAVVLSGAGGILGILLGAGAALGISRVAGFPTVIAPQAVVLAFGFSAAVGIFFGWYPARKASQLDPIEALRYE